MACMTRSLLRWGLLGALALGGATLLVGPDLMAAGLAQVRTRATHVMNSFVDDPVALRRQLEQLGEEYPERIAQVRGELAAVERQMQQLALDTEVARRVVQNSATDLAELKEMIAEAEGTAARGVRVAIRTRGVRLDLAEAKAEARRISDIRLAYQDRLASNQHQLGFLGEQKARLQEVLGRLEAEYGDFETKLTQIDRQIDAIERNERLIEMTKQQKAILADYEKFGKVGNLDQLEAKLAELQAVQEAQLEALAKAGIDRDYEREARRQLHDESESEEDDLFGEDAIDPHQPTASAASSHSVALLGSALASETVIIERKAR